MENKKKLYVLPEAFNRNHELFVGYAGKDKPVEKTFSFEDLVYIPVKCQDCGKEGEVPTLRQVLEKEGTPLREMLDRDGYATVTCGCNEEATV